MTHEEREKIQNELGATMQADDIALFKLRLAMLEDARLYRGTEQHTKAFEELKESLADLIGRLHKTEITKEELER